MTSTLLRLPLLLSLLGACAETEDTGLDSGVELCHRGYSGQSGCCLSADTVSSIGGACESGYFTASECGRLDLVCEGVDAGPGPADIGGLDAGTSSVACDRNPPVFPDFDRSCVVDRDCAVGTRQINCCGTMIVTGVAASVVADFAAAARLCASQYPGCACPAFPTQADDGTIRDPLLDQDATVECVDNTCRTTFPQSPQDCGPNLTCDPAREVCVATEPVGPSVRYECLPVPTACSTDRSCACVQQEFCGSPFDVCVDVEANHVSCQCPECQ